MSRQSKNSSEQVRLVDIARAVGVSVVTVAKVLNNTGGRNVRVGDNTKKRILDYVKTIEYTPNRQAQLLVGGNSDLIGVVMDSGAPIAAHLRLAQIERFAFDKGYRIMVAQIHDDPGKIRRCVADLFAYGAAGILSFTHNYPGFAEESALAFPPEKTVFCDPPALREKVSYVQLDIGHAFRHATTFLANQGRKRIALLLASGITAIPSQAIREQGYRDGLREAGLTFSQALAGYYKLAFFDAVESFFPEIERLVRKGHMDALLCNNDDAALAALVCLEKLGVKVPADVAVIGCDNNVSSRLLGISTISDAMKLQAEKFVELILELIKTSPPPELRRQVTIIPELICRRTT